VGLTVLFSLQQHAQCRPLDKATARQALKRRKSELRDRDHFAKRLICCQYLKSKPYRHVADEAALGSLAETTGS